jgi:hypothetical protein
MKKKIELSIISYFFKQLKVTENSTLKVANY